ncbi:MAG TPA: substrate-binding domain-containing protein [Acetivibrio clariflavus]|nr:substrate-binding domain-containing protein [Acetivibrio clariflavus]
MNIIIYCYDENKEEFETPLSIKEGLISGIITLGRISKKTLTSILKFNLPLVIIDHYFDDLICNYVLTDNISGAYLATEYLIKLGHKDIGFSGDISAASSFYDRFQGYVKALDQYSIPYNKSFCITDKCLYEYKKDSIQRVIDEIKKIPKLPTAFFCCNDIEAITLINALKSINLSVPDDISVIGFDNIELSKNITPELTTMHISKEAMGERAVKLLLERMANPNSLCEKYFYPQCLLKETLQRK